METSDSECFESADEELDSDHEDDCTVALSPEAAKIGRLTIREDEKVSVTTQESNVSNEKPPSNTSQLKTHSSPSAERDSKGAASSLPLKTSVNKAERKSKPPRSTLGTKLGSKIKSNVLSSPSDDKEARTDSALDPQHVTQEPKKINSKINSYTEKFEPSFQSVSSESKNDSSRIQECKKEEENMWDNDDWEPVPSITSQSHIINDEHTSSDWTGWGNWGVTSLLSTATMGVTTIRNHVSQSLNTVLESGIGAPDPEELARLHREEKQSQESNNSENKQPDVSTSDSTFGLGSFVSGVTQITKLVETTGNKMISSGLDTLETIGKKTMEVLQEGDPGLKKKRAFLKIEAEKPVLSQILREAKAKAEYENKLLEEKHYSKKANYETLFDDHQGLVHLEALEMLSRQCDIKLQTLLESQTGNDLIEMQETLSQIKELCELPEEEDETVLSKDEIEEKLNTAASEMNIAISYSKLVSTWIEADEWLDKLNLNICNEMELYEHSINIMAQLTAIAVELFHKTGELLLIKEHRSTVDEADSLVQLTNTMTILLSNVAGNITDKLSSKASQSVNKDNINGLITNVYYEATNSSSYIKNAFQLLIPVLQVGAV